MKYEVPNKGGTIGLVTLNGTQVDVGSPYFRGTRVGLTGGVAVVSGTTATWNATCGSFDVQARCG